VTCLTVKMVIVELALAQRDPNSGCIDSGGETEF
jgi:hypothetical protein